MQIDARISDGLTHVLSEGFQTSAAKDYHRWDKEWMRYFSIHEDYNFYFYDMDTPAYALRLGPAAIAKFSPEEMYTVKLLRNQAAQIWLDGQHVVGKTILEMGCGPGMLGRMASRFVDAYIGIDASKFALHLASLTSPSKCRYIHLGDVEKIRELEGVADACVGRNFFIHHNFDDALWILRFLRDLAKPGGLISADFYLSPERIGEPRRYTATDPLDPVHASALYNFSRADILKIAEAANVEVLSTYEKPEARAPFRNLQNPPSHRLRARRSRLTRSRERRDERQRDGMRFSNLLSRLAIRFGDGKMSYTVRAGSGLLVGSIASGAEGANKAYAAFFVFMDGAGRVLSTPYPGLWHSPAGAYAYLQGGRPGAPSAFSIRFGAPSAARRMEVRFVPWKTKARVRFATKPSIASPTMPSTLFPEITLHEGPFPASNRVEAALRVERQQGDADKAYVATVQQFDGSGNRLSGPIPGMPFSEDVGPYRYVEFSPRSQSAFQEVKLAFSSLPDAATYRIGVRPWRSKSAPAATLKAIRHPVDLAVQVEISSRGLREFLLQARPLAKKGIVLLYATTGPIGRDNRSNRPQCAATEFARMGYAVVYVYYRFDKSADLVESPAPGVYRMPNDVFAVAYGALASNRFAGSKIAIFSIPDDLACRALGLFQAKQWTTVYEVRDDWEEFARKGVGKWYRPTFERFLIRNVGAVACVSPALMKKVQAISGRSSGVFLSPNATTSEFVEAAAPHAARRQVATRKSANPVFGYFGHLDSGVVRLAADHCGGEREAELDVRFDRVRSGRSGAPGQHAGASGCAATRTSR